MLCCDALIAALIKQNAGVVAVIDDGIAHQLYALFPLAPRGIVLGIARRHSLYEAYPVARLHILLPRSDVHPAHKVAT